MIVDIDRVLSYDLDALATRLRRRMPRLRDELESLRVARCLAYAIGDPTLGELRERFDRTADDLDDLVGGLSQVNQLRQRADR